MCRELQTMNQLNKLTPVGWRISECLYSGMAVKALCSQNDYRTYVKK